jgi:putative oxidoreductase
MQVVPLLNRANALAGAALAPLLPAFLLVLRLYVSWQFLKSGWLKLQDWETTRFLFEEEYRVPLLSPPLAAVLGTAGEIVFPLLLIAGLLGRYAALGLSAVNVLAVVAYAHVLTSEGFEAALGQHYFWGLMLATLVVVGPGRLSLDAMLEGRGTAANAGTPLR